MDPFMSCLSSWNVYVKVFFLLIWNSYHLTRDFVFFSWEKFFFFGIWSNKSNNNFEWAMRYGCLLNFIIINILWLWWATRFKITKSWTKFEKFSLWWIKTNASLLLLSSSSKLSLMVYRKILFKTSFFYSNLSNLQKTLLISFVLNITCYDWWSFWFEWSFINGLSCKILVQLHGLRTKGHDARSKRNISYCRVLCVVCMWRVEIR